MLKLARLVLFLAAGFLMVEAVASAQDLATYPLQPESKVWIDGTSNKSDWTVHVTEMSGFVKMHATPTAAEHGVEEAHLTFVANKIVSQKSTIMDRLLHKTLKAAAHPEIAFTLTEVKPATADQQDPNAFLLMAVGTLSLGGVTKDVEILVEGKMLENGQVQFVGHHTLLMTDYDLEPPVAMFGALRTADEVTVHAELVAAQEMTGSQ